MPGHQRLRRDHRLAVRGDSGHLVHGPGFRRCDVPDIASRVLQRDRIRPPGNLGHGTGLRPLDNVLPEPVHQAGGGPPLQPDPRARERRVHRLLQGRGRRAGPLRGPLPEPRRHDLPEHPGAHGPEHLQPELPLRHLRGRAPHGGSRLPARRDRVRGDRAGGHGLQRHPRRADAHHEQAGGTLELLRAGAALAHPGHGLAARRLARQGLAAQWRGRYLHRLHRAPAHQPRGPADARDDAADAAARGLPAADARGAPLAAALGRPDAADRRGQRHRQELAAPRCRRPLVRRLRQYRPLRRQLGLLHAPEALHVHRDDAGAAPLPRREPPQRRQRCARGGPQRGGPGLSPGAPQPLGLQGVGRPPLPRRTAAHQLCAGAPEAGRPPGAHRRGHLRVRPQQRGPPVRPPAAEDRQLRLRGP
mmetsp:Transcript_100165/g.298960  ORF Transcript_100165/g.298960 Transcript_100165/m.298960 type:complete len:418 (+) Transcript_100165:560-1813(+)